MGSSPYTVKWFIRIKHYISRHWILAYILDSINYEYSGFEQGHTLAW